MVQKLAEPNFSNWKKNWCASSARFSRNFRKTSKGGSYAPPLSLRRVKRKSEKFADKITGRFPKVTLVDNYWLFLQKGFLLKIKSFFDNFRYLSQKMRSSTQMVLSQFWPHKVPPRRVLRAYLPNSEYPAPPGQLCFVDTKTNPMGGGNRNRDRH